MILSIISFKTLQKTLRFSKNITTSIQPKMRIQSLDILPKLDKDYRIGTPVGGILSIISLIATIFLFYFEFKDFLNPPFKQKLLISNTRPTGPDGITISSKYQPRLYVDIDVTFPAISCYLLHFDALESITQLPVPLEDKQINFTRLEQKSGRSIGNFPRKFMKTVPIDGCGSCYEANTTKCCNTCSEVYKAYRLDGLPPPDLRNISQCQSVTKLISTMDNEGCRVSASFHTIKFASEFHISPGLSWYTGGWHVHDLRPFRKNFFLLNLSHIINKLTFSEDPKEKMPLDGFVNLQMKTNKTWKAVYTLDVIDTEYSASHFEIYNSRTSPGIIFKYDVSPITAIQYQERNSFISLFTSFVIIVGGVLMFFRMLDSVLFMKDPLNPQITKITQ